MGRSPQAPYDFECPYQDACPHMDRHSATWALLQIQEAERLNGDYWRLSDSYNDEVNTLHETIKQLENENAQLKAQLKALHQRQFKANRKPKPGKNKESTPEDSNSEEMPRPRGAPKGHPFWGRRPPGPVDQIIEVSAPTICPHCQCDHLLPSDTIHEHLQEDIVLQPKTRVVSFKHEQAFCPMCRRLVFKEGPGELRNCSIGPVTKATAVYLRYGLRIPYRQVQQLFSTLFDMPFVPASALAFDRKATEKGLPLYDDLKAKLKQAQKAYADETFWRQDGQNGYVWYAGNEDLAVFHIAMSRASEEAIELLGENFGGSLVTDGYAGYLPIQPRHHQTCLAHMIRKAREILEEIHHLPEAQRDPRAIQFCQDVENLFQKACEVGRLRNTGQIPQQQAEAMINDFNEAIDDITEGAVLNHEKAENLRQRIMSPDRDYNRLFVFLKVPGLSPTNNHAEQTLRTPVIFRKVCFGTRSDEGSLSHSVLPSLLVTSIRQGNHPLAFLQTLFTKDTATAQTALYHDSS